MKAYWWKAGDWIGIAVGRDWEELFYAVDHQVSPMDCLYIPATSFCASWLFDWNDEDDKEPKFEVEIDSAPDAEDSRWKPIDWDKRLDPESHAAKIKKIIEAGMGL